MLTCVHCGEPIEHAEGVWYHPHRRFRGHSGELPVLCDFGERVGPTRATPVAITLADKEFLYSMHVAADAEDFLLEALWVEWERANVRQGISACPGCGAAPGGQHALECRLHAPMTFEPVHSSHAHVRTFFERAAGRLRR